MDSKTALPIHPAGCHRLPQIPTMGRSLRTAQSKSSARQKLIEMSDTVKFWSDDVKVKDNDSAIIAEDSDVKPDDCRGCVESSVDENLEENFKQEVVEDEPVNPEENFRQEVVQGEPVNPEENFKQEVVQDEPVNPEPTTKEGHPHETMKDNGSNGALSTSTLKTSRRKSHGSNSTNERNSMGKRSKLRSDVQNDAATQASHDTEANDELVLRFPGKIQSPLEKKKSTSKFSADRNESDIGGVETELGEVDTDFDTEDKSFKEHKKEHIPRCVIVTASEVPSDVLREKMLEMQSVGFDLEHPPTLKEGDMSWGKVSGHPYWPCMVSPCPFTQMITRTKGGVGKSTRAYHVQFFGNDCERGWISAASLMEYKGKDDFLELMRLDSLKSKTIKKYKSSYNPFKIKPTRLPEWELSVTEAEEAYALSIPERIAQYAFDYLFIDDVEKKKKVTSTPSGQGKRKRKESISPKQKSKKRKVDLHSNIISGEIDADCSFDVYYAKQRDAVMEIHPDWDSSAVFDYLKQQWSALSPPSSNISPESASGCGKRTKKPTMKLVESIFQARAHNDGAAVKSEDTPRKRGRPRKIKPCDDEKSTNASAFGKDKGSEVGRTLSTSALSSQDSDNPEVSTQLHKKKRYRNSSLGAKNSVSAKGVSSSEDLSSPKPACAALFLASRKSSTEGSESSSEGRGKKMRVQEPYQLEIFKLQSTSKIEKEHICSVCESNGELIECQGLCYRHFHPQCLEIQPKVVEEFKCKECTSGAHECFSCKTTDLSTKKCSVHQCGKFYHDSCIQKLRLARVGGESKGFICPLHACQTCSVDNVKKTKASKGRLFRCIRCPSAFHFGDLCISAGSKVLGGGYIVCGDHFQPNKSLSTHAHVNIPWCFLCSKGGALICCESCPASFHAECAKVEKTPDEKEAWFCEECRAGARPLYGNIVWIKVGNYRWWPGEICHPRHVPLNIQEKAHQIGEFPVRFFGSHDYYWIHKGRVFLFEEGDKASRDHSSKSLYKMYTKGVEEATEAFKEWKAAKERKEEQEQERNDKKPSVFKYVKKNIPIGNVQIDVAELSEIPRCECKADQEEACSSDCLNRMVMYECHPAVCHAGEKCNNQRFQKRQYASCEPLRSDGRGWGLQATQDIKKGQFVMEYVGDLIDEEECKRRIQLAHDNNITNFYMLTMDKNRIIDAGPRGNNSRFMNHSCCPNLETQKWMVGGDIRVGLFALCDINKGTELTFNYNLECLGNEKTACACGAENCSGFLGVRPKTAAALANERKVKEMKKKKKKKRIDPKKEHEDECFRCGEGGELVMCDKGNCPKVYHLQCLNLTKPPSGKWSCPWHHCDMCGKAATSLCTVCPNSFCQGHTEGNIIQTSGCLICRDHEDCIEGVSHILTGKMSNNSQASTDDDSTESSTVDHLKSIDRKEQEAEVNGVVVPLEEETKKDVAKNDRRNKVVKRKSFKDILKEESTVGNKTLPKKMKNKVDNTSNSLLLDVTKDTKLKQIPNGDTVVVDGNLAHSVIASEQGEKIGIRLKKAPSVGRGGKVASTCRTKAKYKAQLLSSSPGYERPVVFRPANALPAHLATRNQDDSEDNDSLSDLVIDIPQA